MPYIIETTQSCGYCMHCGYSGERVATCLHRKTNRTAVATLDEARTHAFRQMVKHWPGKRVGEGPDLTRLPESGGTIGPLPDGTVIEVRWRSWPDLQTDAGIHGLPRADSYVLATFNR